ALVDAVTLRKACDTTGTSTNDGYSEAAFTTDVVARLSSQLRDLGATVVLTRDATTPWGPCITERAAIGNEARADLAISVHADGGPGAGRGFHVISPASGAGMPEGAVAESARFAQTLRDVLEADTEIPPADYIAVDGLDVRSDLG